MSCEVGKGFLTQVRQWMTVHLMLVKWRSDVENQVWRTQEMAKRLHVAYASPHEPEGWREQWASERKTHGTSTVERPASWEDSRAPFVQENLNYTSTTMFMSVRKKPLYIEWQETDHVTIGTRSAISWSWEIHKRFKPGRLVIIKYKYLYWLIYAYIYSHDEEQEWLVWSKKNYNFKVGTCCSRKNSAQICNKLLTGGTFKHTSWKRHFNTYGGCLAIKLFCFNVSQGFHVVQAALELTM